LDKRTAKEKWVSEDALTHYTPGFSRDALGKPTAMIGRGGYHDVPELPIGYSMIDLENGKRIWHAVFDKKEDTALSNAYFIKDFAVWISENENQLTVLNPSNGEIIKTMDLRSNVETWSLNTPTFAGGKLYHRTAQELICVGSKN
jgi:hypothetical protein